LTLSQKKEKTLIITGFAVVGDYQDASIQEAQRNAFDQMLAWLGSH